MRAFRSTLEEFEDRRSITSAQSCSSVHVGNMAWSYISLASFSSMQPPGSATFSADQLKPEARSVSFVHRTSIPQPYPYYHSQQPRIAVNSTAVTDLSSPKRGSPKRNSPKARTPRSGPRKGGKNGNGKLDASDIVDEISLTHSMEGEEDSPKVPLIQRYCPASGSSYSQKMGKSISLDTPVTVAHV